MPRTTLTALAFAAVLPLAPAPAVAGVCGDGMIDYSTEQCDDGNTRDGDGCSAGCQSEDGSHTIPICGDGVLQGDEQCDGGAYCSDCTLQIPTSATVDVSSCGTFSQANTLYRIVNDLSSSDTCLTFAANGIVVDGQGHRIDAGGVGIYLREWNREAVVIDNVRVHTTGRAAIAGRSVRHVLISNAWLVSRAASDDLSANLVNMAESHHVVLEDSVLENHVSTVINRHAYSGASVRLGSEAIVRRCVFVGSPQNGVVAGDDVHIFNNYANGGTEIEADSPSVGYTNNFFVVGWDVGNVILNNNVLVSSGYFAQAYALAGTTATEVVAVDLPLLLAHHLSGSLLTRPLKVVAGRPQSRGLFGEDGTTAQTGVRIFNNYSSSYVAPNNLEYSGCQLGGATGIQLESIVTGAHVFSNRLVAVAGECYANAIKPASVHADNSDPNIIEDNDILAVKVERGSGDTLDLSAWKERATAFHARESIPGTRIINNTVTTLVVDESGSSLATIDTGGSDITLWQLGDAFGADGMVIENTTIDMTRTPNERFLSVARTWDDSLHEEPAPQTITWKSTRFVDEGSQALFLANIQAVHSAWDIEQGDVPPATYPQVVIVVDGTSVVGNGVAPAPPSGLRIR